MHHADELANMEHSRLRAHLSLSRFDEARSLIAEAKSRGVSLLDLQTYRGSSGLFKLFASRLSVFKFLLDEGATFVKAPQPPGQDDQMLSELLLEHESQLPAIKELVNRYGLDQVQVVFPGGWTFMHSAALFQNAAALRYIYEVWPESLHMKDDQGDTPGSLVQKILSTRTGRLPAKQLALRRFFEAVPLQPDQVDLSPVHGGAHDHFG